MNTDVILAIISLISSLGVAAISLLGIWIANKNKNELKKSNEDTTGKILEDNLTMKKGIQQSLRHDLKDIYDQWWNNIYIAKTHKYIPKEIVDEFRDMYNAYHALGENGVMTDAMNWMEANKEMPTPDKL